LFVLTLILFHTLNGGFGLYSIYKLQQLSRDCEELINNDKGLDDDTNLDLELRKVFDLIKQGFVELKDDILSLFKDCENVVEIDKSIFFYIESTIQEKGDDELKHIFEEYIYKESISERIKIYNPLIIDLSEKLGEKIESLIFVGDDLRMKKNLYEDFFSSLVHLFRNCVDHGIESVDERLNSGKLETGKIKVELSSCDLEGLAHFKIAIQDDGGGIDPARIRNKLAELGRSSKAENITDDNIIYEIFEPSFSTATELTNISGRGVGMSAINETEGKSSLLCIRNLTGV
jgi:two-component system chemotaxis sensor kinase CheA